MQEVRDLPLSERVDALQGRPAKDLRLLQKAGDLLQTCEYTERSHLMRPPRCVPTTLVLLIIGSFLTALPAHAVEAEYCFGKHFTIDARGQGDKPIYGTKRADVIIGGNIVYGRGGNDRICSSGGPDVVYGGPGNDMIDGEEQPDLLIEGGPGDDILIAGLHGCYCEGGFEPGGEVLSVRDATGPTTVDLINGYATGPGIGYDTLLMPYGQQQFMEVLGSPYADTIRVGQAWAGNVVQGFGGNDTIYGYDDPYPADPNSEDTVRADHLYGGVGNDRLFGLGGPDDLYGNRGNDLLNGGLHGDSAIYGGPPPITIDWTRCIITGSEGTDQMVGIEAANGEATQANVIGSPPC